MGRLKGNTLIEALFAFMIILIILISTSSIFRNINKIKFHFHNDLSYCLYSLTQEVILANWIEVYDQQLILHSADNVYQFELNNRRLVKVPGFNIYLHNVDEVIFSHDNTFVYIVIKRGNLNEKYKIGVYKRPLPRDDQSSSNNDICDDDIADHVNVGDVE